MLGDLLEVSIPAVVLIPVVVVGVVLWMCFQQSARSSGVRRAEVQRLQRLAMAEHDQAERELEREYLRRKQGGEPHGSISEPHLPHQALRGAPEPHGFDSRRRGGGGGGQRQGPPGNGYGNMDIGLGEWRDPEGDSRRRKQAEEEEQRRKHAEAVLQRRKQAEAEELRKKQEEIADRKRIENLDEEMRRRRREAEDQEWQRKRADLEAQARKEAEEERRRQAVEHDKQRRWKHEEAMKQEPVNTSPRNVPPMSGLNCVVCHKPTKVKRRCARCKSMNYCSRECQVQHWSDGHKFECRPHDTSASPRGSIDGDIRNFSDFSPRG